MGTLLDSINETRAALKSVPDEKKEILLDLLVNLTQKMIDNVMIFGDLPESYTKTLLPAITAQLEAADKRTERAANALLGSGEAIMGAIGKPNAKEIITNEVNKIYEACSFQDLVSQHLNEIKLRLEDLTADMNDLKASVDALGGADSAKGGERAKRQKRPDAHLLNGPATNV